MSGLRRSCCCGKGCERYGCRTVPTMVRATLTGWTAFGSSPCSTDDYVDGEYILEPVIYDPQKHCCVLACRVETWPDLVQRYLSSDLVTEIDVASPAWLVLIFSATSTTVTASLYAFPEDAPAGAEPPTYSGDGLANCWREGSPVDVGDLAAATGSLLWTETRTHPEAEPYACAKWAELEPGTQTLGGLTQVWRFGGDSVCGNEPGIGATALIEVLA